MPSTFPEAFGMVAAEAAACGALPVCADHSGLAEVARRARATPCRRLARPWLAFPVGEGAVRAIAERLVGVARRRPAALREADARGARRDGARALVVGGRRARRDRRRAGPARRAAGAGAALLRAGRSHVLAHQPHARIASGSHDGLDRAERSGVRRNGDGRGRCGRVRRLRQRQGRSRRSRAGQAAVRAKCGACHTLARAGTKGTVGPNLDDAFARSLSDGFQPRHRRGRRQAADPLARR